MLLGPKYRSQTVNQQTTSEPKSLPLSYSAISAKRLRDLSRGHTHVPTYITGDALGNGGDVVRDILPSTDFSAELKTDEWIIVICMMVSLWSVCACVCAVVCVCMCVCCGLCVHVCVLWSVCACVCAGNR